MYNEIVSTEYQHELLQIRDNVTKDSWKIGDITLAIKAEHPEFAANIIYSAVGSFVGKASRTVREYAAISAFYSPETRSEFDVLAYDHFRTAMQLGSMWKQALEYAVKAVDDLNRPATVDMMEYAFEGGETSENFKQIENDQEKSDLGTVLRVAERLRDLVSRQPELHDWESSITGFIEFVARAMSRDPVADLKQL